MNDFEIEFPAGFDDYAWEVEAKGLLPDVVVVIGGRRFAVTIYDPTRLAQDIQSHVDLELPFFQRNLLVVPIVTRANVETAIARALREIIDHTAHQQ